VIYARKRFYVNKSGYTGNFLKYCIKSVNYASKYGTFLHQGVSQFRLARRVVLLSFLPSLSAPVYVMTGVVRLLVNTVTTGVPRSYRIPDILMLLTNFGGINRPNKCVTANSKNFYVPVTVHREKFL